MTPEKITLQEAMVQFVPEAQAIFALADKLAERDAVLRQALFGLQTCYPSDERDKAIAAIKGVLK
jgi:hypothetical protein